MGSSILQTHPANAGWVMSHRDIVVKTLVPALLSVGGWLITGFSGGHGVEGYYDLACTLIIGLIRSPLNGASLNTTACINGHILDVVDFNATACPDTAIDIITGDISVGFGITWMSLHRWRQGCKVHHHS